MLREHVKMFLKVSGMPKTKFCQNVGISTNHLYGWLKKEREFSDELVQRIETYISNYQNSLNSF